MNLASHAFRRFEGFALLQMLKDFEAYVHRTSVPPMPSESPNPKP